jgi:hypothetical protein
VLRCLPLVRRPAMMLATMRAVEAMRDAMM